MKRNSRRAGISLVALVITIIVLIILTGAVIVTFMEGGIIDRAKESVFKNDMRTYQEILALKRAENQMEIALGGKEDVEINASTLAEIQEIIPEFKEEYEGLVVITDGELSIGERVSGEELSSSEELYATWLSDLGIGLSRLPKNALALVEGLEVGDYVEYIPEGNNVTSYELLGEYSGYSYAQDGILENQEIERQNKNWRVLKNDERQVTLISEIPVGSISLDGGKGFINGPDLLDEICDKLYSGNKGKSRSISLKDINELLAVPKIKAEYYNERDNITVQVEEGTTIGDVFKQTGDTIIIDYIPAGNIEEYELTKISRYIDGSYRNQENGKIYDLIFKTPTGNTNATEYWLSTTWVGAYPTYGAVEFGIYYVYGGTVYTIELANSTSTHDEGYSYAYGTYAVRPIVILNSDVEVSNPSAGGDTVDTAWQLK